MAINVRDEGSKVNSNINVTPMVDVMLVLLIIFMVITPMLQNKVNIDLAKVTDPTAMPDADKEDAVVVAVTRDGKVYLGQNQVSMADLGPKVADMLQNKTSKEIFMRADSRAQYSAVMEAIDNCRTAGVDQVGLLTERTQANQPPPNLHPPQARSNSPAFLRNVRAERKAKEGIYMAMSMGGGGGLSHDINVTPLIDVLLVLLIIFMVIVPVTPTGLDALVPQPPKNPQKQQDNDRTIVVQVLYHSGAAARLQNQRDACHPRRPGKQAFRHLRHARGKSYVHQGR